MRDTSLYLILRRGVDLQFAPGRQLRLTRTHGRTRMTLPFGLGA